MNWKQEESVFWLTALSRPLVEILATAERKSKAPIFMRSMMIRSTFMQDMHAAAECWTSLKVLLVLMETVEVVRVPGSERDIKNLHQVLAHVIEKGILNKWMNKLTF